MFQSDEGRLVADAASKLFEQITPAMFEDVEAGAWPAALWSSLEEAGLPLALVAEEAGGFGLPIEDGLALITFSAEKAVPAPLAETMIGNFLASRAGFDVVPGALTFGGGALQLTRERDGWLLSGLAKRIPWARHANLILVADSADGPKLAYVEHGLAEITQQLNLAGEPRDDVSLELRIEESRVRPFPGGADTVRLFGAGMRCLQMAGAMRTILDMTVTHVTERQQFGRALGAFQAVQHQVAILASETAAGRVAGQIAQGALAAEADPQAIAAAKIRAGEAVGRVASIAHQLHGAMGFTHEYALHHFIRRLWSWRDEFGGETFWSARLGNQLAGAGAGGLWPALTAI